MEAKFTPGPWVNRRNMEKPDRVSSYRVVAGIGQIIATVRRPISGSGEEMEANARLIAAAPAMYEALTAFIEWLDARNVPTYGVGEAAILARAAIQMAERTV